MLSCFPLTVKLFGLVCCRLPWHTLPLYFLALHVVYCLSLLLLNIFFLSLAWCDVRSSVLECYVFTFGALPFRYTRLILTRLAWFSLQWYRLTSTSLLSTEFRSPALTSHDVTLFPLHWFTCADVFWFTFPCPGLSYIFAFVNWSRCDML